MTTLELDGRINENGDLEVHLPAGLPAVEVKVRIDLPDSENNWQEQLTVVELLREYVDYPEISRDEIREMRKFLKQPLPGVYVKRLRSSLQDFKLSKNILDLLAVARELQQAFGVVETVEKPQQHISREDLHLTCYEYVCS